MLEDKLFSGIVHGHNSGESRLGAEGAKKISNLSGKRTEYINLYLCIREKGVYFFMLQVLNNINDIVWGPPLLILLMGTALLLTIRLGLIQVLKLPLALKLIFSAKSEGKGDVSSFKALCTALAATVGTGNIVGVATAVKVGGPGALFWMWLAAFFGMATKYAECLLAVKYRSIDADGNIAGGPMHYIEKGLGKKYKPLAYAFAIFGFMCAILSNGTFTQTNAITNIIFVTVGFNPIICSTIIAVAVAIITIGGLKSIANVASKIVPAMAMGYLACTGGILYTFADQIPGAIQAIIDGAFTGTAAKGGFIGASMMIALRSGVARGVYSNESGLGSAPIAAAAARTKWAAEQGLVSMTGTFIDTIIICSLTGLTLIVTGVWCGDANGAAMTASAFSMAFPQYGKIMLMVSLVLCAFTTIIGWNYYGERCIEYVFGTHIIKPYRILYILAIASTPFLKLEEIWTLADIVNGLMAFPNLVALVGLSGVVVAETKIYMNAVKENRV